MARLSLLLALILTAWTFSPFAEEPVDEAVVDETAVDEPRASGEQSDELIEDGGEEEPGVIPSQSEEVHYCFASSKPWEPSPGRVEVVFAERNKLKRARFVNLGYFIFAVGDFQKQGRQLTTRKISVVDYATFGTPNEHMIEIDRDNTNAWFAFTDKRVNKAATAPYVFAFESKEAAEAFVEKHGGKVMEYSDILGKLARQVNSDENGKGGEFGRQLMN